MKQPRGGRFDAFCQGLDYVRIASEGHFSELYVDIARGEEAPRTERVYDDLLSGDSERVSRACYELREVRGRTWQSIANMLGVSYPAVCKRVAKYKQKLALA